MADQQADRPSRPARPTRSRKPAAPKVRAAAAGDLAPVAPVEDDRPVTPRRIAAVTRDVVSAFTALESATAEAQSKNHPLTLRRSGEGKFVATCSRCGLDLPVLNTARGWTYPSLGDCPS